MTEQEKEIAALKEKISVLEAHIISLTKQLQYPPYQAPYPYPVRH